MMGTIAVMAAVATFLLPETKDTKLLSTIEEAEAFGEANSSLRRFRNLCLKIKRYRSYKACRPSTLVVENSQKSPVPEIVITFHDVGTLPSDCPLPPGLRPSHSNLDTTNAEGLPSSESLAKERRASLLAQRKFSMV